VFEENALVGLNAIGAAFKETAGEDVGSIVAVIVYTGVALAVDPEAEMGLSRPGDEDAQVGGKKNVGILAGKVAGFECATVDGDHEAASRDRDVGGEMNFGGGAHVKEAAAGEADVRGPVGGGDGSVIADYGMTFFDRERTGQRHALERDGSDGGRRGGLIDRLGYNRRVCDGWLGRGRRGRGRVLSRGRSGGRRIRLLGGGTAGKASRSERQNWDE
jgi:hypothetical protein